MKLTISLISVLFFINNAYSQILKKLEDQVPHEEILYDDSIVDPYYGITIYEPLNMFLHADSTRNCSGYLCNGWITDKYKNGQMIHKGFYLDGQLKIYKNFYPDGSLERSFTTVDNYRCNVKLYFPGGNLKSSVKYLHGEPVLWIDYYENGNEKFKEEFHKSLTYHIEKRSFYETGTVEDELVLSDKKKLCYDKNEYFPNGQIKTDGEMTFNKTSYDYFKSGVWKHFDNSGKLIKEVTYKNGNISEEKNY